MQTEPHSRIAGFARRFFIGLEEQGVENAVLHGGANGFERGVSDIDFVVSQEDFVRLPELIHEACRAEGWQLCQILRHETTAAYFVVSAIDDPACALALDACSDYQRNGSSFLSANELLCEREPLPWGGHGLAPGTELKYRFAKAAAKNKDPEACAQEFERYDVDSRERCAVWLAEGWQIELGTWDAGDVSSALGLLRIKSNSRPSFLQRGSTSRIIERIVRPTGLAVVTGKEEFKASATLLGNVFGNLYFRKVGKTEHWQPMLFKDLVSSTLVLLPRLPRYWRKLLPSDCVFDLEPTEDNNGRLNSIARHLHLRCLSRERLEARPAPSNA